MDYGYYKKNARNSLAGKWNTIIIGSLIYMGLTSVCQIPSLFSSVYEMMVMLKIEVPEFLGSIYTLSAFSAMNGAAGLISTFALPILVFGFFSIGYKAVNGQKIEHLTVFDGFRNFVNVFLLNLLTGIYVFLWSMLFIIPGIVKAYSYSMAQFIMVENPDISPSDAIKESKKLMDGNKLDYFLLELSFIGWQILNLFTLGALSIWLTPYMYATFAVFFEAVKKEKYGDYAPYVYKNMLYKQIEEGYFGSQQGTAPYGQNPYGYTPNQQGTAPYGQNPYGYTPNQQGTAPYGQNPYGYTPNQQGTAHYGQNSYGYTPNQQGTAHYGQNSYGYTPNQQSGAPYSGYNSLPQGEYTNPIPAPQQSTSPESNPGTKPYAAEQNDNN